jgi:hypothetical protein
MLAAEKGLPLKPLDKSVQPPPEDESLLASGATWGNTDDESQLPHGETPEIHAEQQPERRRSGGILGWLFGSGDEGNDH